MTEQSTSSQGSAPAPPLPLGQLVGAMALAAAAGLGLLYLVTPLLFSEEGARAAAMWTAAGAFAAMLLSLVPLAAVRALGGTAMMPLLYAYFAGVAVRLVAALVVVLAVVAGAGLPALPAVLGLALYLPLLFLETGYLGRHLWQQSDAGASQSPSTENAS